VAYDAVVPSERTMKRLLELGFIGSEEPEPFWDDFDFGRMYDRDGEPITMRQWGMLTHDLEYKVLKQEDVGPYWVSTVWLGIDHGYEFYGLPIIFETMVFKGDRSDVECWRYATEAEAFAGHERMCEQVRVMLAASP
jgi:hypothetical protein